ncbi:MAG: sugar ABC transporter ATP-binding protein, partial [bacterium]|nr:sugar ABC transporter ATP-binding protein [bacterium]
ASLTLHKGEMLGVFGLEGSGTAELSRLLFGLDQPISGRIDVGGEQISPVSPQEMIDRGVTYLSPNRSVAGLYLSRALTDTVTSAILNRISHWGMIDSRQVRRKAEEFKQRFNIKAPSINSTPASLSGGNQQKVMMAACLSPDPDILIANDPTRGVDVGAKAEMHRKLVELSEDGASVIVFSAELPELLGLCDRIIIMRDNRIVGELTGGGRTEEAAMALAAADSHEVGTENDRS